MPNTTTSSTRIPGDLIAALAMLDVLDQDGNRLAGVARLYHLVDPDTTEAILRDQLRRLTLEARSLAQSLAGVSRKWQDPVLAAEAAERGAEIAAEIAANTEIGRLRVPTPSRDLAVRPDTDLELPPADASIPADLLAALPRLRRRRHWHRFAPPARIIAWTIIVGLSMLAAASLAAGGWALAAAVTR